MKGQVQVMAQTKYPVYHDGRGIVVLSRQTKKGQAILARALRNEGFQLSSCYTRPSQAKQAIYEDCYQMYLRDVDAHGFHICSHNVNQFSVTWTTASGVVVLLTRDYEYIVTD